MISVILPATRDEPAALETLAALVEGVADGIVRDCVLVSARPSALYETFADAAGCRLVIGDEPRDGLVRLGAENVRSDWSLVVTPGLIPSGDWLAELVDWLASRPHETEAAYFPYRPGRSVSAAALAFLQNRMPLWSGRPHPLHGFIAATSALRPSVKKHFSCTRLRAPMLDRRTKGEGYGAV
jgi:hypothetical protein